MVKLSTKKEKRNEQVDEQPVITHITDPTTNERIPVEDIDRLIALYEKMDGYKQRATTALYEVRDALFRQTKEDKVTRRIRGKERTAVLTLPNESWDQSILLEAWNSYPNIRDEILKIGAIKVKKREYNKMVGTYGDKAFEQFKGMVQRACKGRVGMPRIKIEK
jgi:hypothetical protein